MSIIQLNVPPLPYYIIGGHHMMRPGRKHPTRVGIGVFDFILVKEGCLYIGEEDRHYEVTEGKMLILRPDAAHYATRACEVTTAYYWVHFKTTGDWAALDDTHTAAAPHDGAEPVPIAEQFATRAFVKQLPQFAKAPGLAKLEDMLRQLAGMSMSDHIPGIRWKQQLLFQDVIGHISAAVESRAPTPAAYCAEQAASYLREHYREDVTAQALGEAINFHPVYIARCMKREFGCTPFDYLLRFRIEQAKLLLLQTDLPVSRIAEEVGFNQAAYFATCFARFEGISPRQYRQRFERG